MRPGNDCDNIYCTKRYGHLDACDPPLSQNDSGMPADPWRPNREERQAIWTRINEGRASRNDCFGLVYMADHLDDEVAALRAELRVADDTIVAKSQEVVTLRAELGGVLEALRIVIDSGADEDFSRTAIRALLTKYRHDQQSED